MPAARPALAALMMGATGIVYGDIGTSVLYAFKEVFLSGHVPITHENVYGVLSLLFWTITLIVTFKYIGLVLRADNKGEGGMVAMVALAATAVSGRPRLRSILMGIGVLGTALFYGDGVITPAISVLSAVEGLELLTPGLHPYVVPITLAALWGLFHVQKYGTAGIARYFGPVMLLWFVVIGSLGGVYIVDSPHILNAMLPGYGLGFIRSQPAVAFLILGALVLCVTGAEALYADMGHFGRRPIRLAWFIVVMPALILNYFGQGALLLADPTMVHSPFFLMAPEWGRAGLVLLATVATIIASQALITGAFSITRQIMQLGYLPRLQVLHPSADLAGQIYLPVVNWFLFVAVVLAVLFFKSSGALASAYGIAVCGLMLTTTILSFFVIRYRWKMPLAICLLSTGAFLTIDLLFLSSAVLKIPSGGWFPLVLATVLFALMRTWNKGQRRLNAARSSRTVELVSFLDSLLTEAPHRVPGTAVFLTSEPGQTPGAFLHNLKHNRVLHERNLFLTVRFLEEPTVASDARASVEVLGRDCYRVILRYGFKDDPNVPQDLMAVPFPGYDFEPMATSYFLGRDTVVPRRSQRGTRLWQNKVFAHMHRNAGAISDHLKLPNNALVELGGAYEI